LFIGHFATAYAAKRWAPRTSLGTPPPPSIEAVGWAGAIGGLLLWALAAWVDRHREPA
jgi:hypothetical protein